MAGKEYRVRLKRLSKRLGPCGATPSHGWGVPAEEIRRNFLERVEIVGDAMDEDVDLDECLLQAMDEALRRGGFDK